MQVYFNDVVRASVNRITVFFVRRFGSMKLCLVIGGEFALRRVVEFYEIRREVVFDEFFDVRFGVFQQF